MARIVVLVLGGVLAVLFLWVVIARFVNPVDSEWMTGSVRESVARVRDGRQIYIAPSAGFVPFVYTPLYVWLAAALARGCSVFVACKVVSLAATAVTAWGIVQLARIFGASRFWTAVGVLLHISTYSVTLYFFDIERVDAFSSSVVILALVLLLGGDGGTRRTALAGALFGLAFFAKQPGLFALVAAVSGLVLARERRRALLVLGVAAAVFALMLAYLEGRTGGWFAYYCMKIPRSHGIEPALLSTFFIVDLPKVFVLAAGSAAVTIPVAWSALRRRLPPEGMPWREVVFAAVVAAGLAGAFFLRAHRGGWTNVIIAWTPLGCAAAAIAASKMERLAASTTLARPVSVLLLVGVALQFMGNSFDPNEVAPDSSDKKASEKFTRFVRSVEQQGEVVVTTTGDITQTAHFHAAALFDVVRAGDHAPEDYLSALRDRRYAALFVGAPDEFMCELASCKELSNTTLQNYFVAARLEERPKTGMIGYDGRPRWVLRPRQTTLQTLTRKALEARMRQEMGLAEMERLAAAPDADVVIDDGIEELASHMTAPPEKRD
jgi:4-amino-4-deoxy-L-arabinose transferase-like glycosyltransferase